MLELADRVAQMFFPGERFITESSETLLFSNRFKAEEAIQISSSKFKGYDDAKEAYDNRFLTVTSPRLRSAMEVSQDYAVSALRNVDVRQECFDRFKQQLLNYFARMQDSAKSYVSKLGLYYGSVNTPEKLVQAISDAMDLARFVPIGTVTSSELSIRPVGGDKKSVRSVGSFYFHGVLWQDDTWATNFTARISLHLSQLDGEAANHESSDFELGLFYDLKYDPKMEKVTEHTNYFTVTSFSNWLKIKASLFLRKHTVNKVELISRDEAIEEYRNLVRTAYKSARDDTILQSAALSLVGAVQFWAACLKKQRFPNDSSIHVPEIPRAVEGVYQPVSSAMFTPKVSVVLSDSGVPTQNPTVVRDFLMGVLNALLTPTADSKDIIDKTTSRTYLATADSVFSVIQYRLQQALYAQTSRAASFRDLLEAVAYITEDEEQEKGYTFERAIHGFILYSEKIPVVIRSLIALVAESDTVFKRMVVDVLRGERRPEYLSLPDAQSFWDSRVLKQDKDRVFPAAPLLRLYYDFSTLTKEMFDQL